MPNPGEIRFVEYITELAQDTGTRAALRSGLGRTVNQAERMHAYLAPWTDSAKPHEEAVRYTVASLIAHNPDGAIPSTHAPVNIGASIARHPKLVPATREASVHLLSRQPASLLCRMLTRVVISLRSEHVPVDFAVLLNDAVRWPWRRNDIARRWLQAYYRAESLRPEEETALE